MPTSEQQFSFKPFYTFYFTLQENHSDYRGQFTDSYLHQ